MPLYEYECAPHHHRFDVRHGMNEESPTVCAVCGEGPVRRVIQPVGIVFKGSGFYATDSRGSSQAAKPAGESTPAEPKSDTPSDGTAAPAAETKAPAAKTEPSSTT